MSKFAAMAIPSMALMQQHDARRDILVEPAARRRAAIEARGHSQLRAFGTGGVRNWGRNRAVKTALLNCTLLTAGNSGCVTSSTTLSNNFISAAPRLTNESLYLKKITKEFRPYVVKVD